MTGMVVKVSESIRGYMAVVHLNAAVLALKQLRNALALKKGEEDPATTSPPYASMCVLETVAFPETRINELFEDVSVNGLADQVGPQKAKEILGDKIVPLKSFWEVTSRGRSVGTFAKYNAFLGAMGITGFSKGEGIGKKVNDLISLRNAIHHFVPKTEVIYSDTGKLDVHDLITRLKQHYPLNGSKGGAYFRRILSLGCAEWAINTAIGFADDFHKRAGLWISYDNARPENILGESIKISRPA